MINEQIAGLLRNNAGNPQMVSRIARENNVSQDEIAGALRIPRGSAARYFGRGQPRPFDRGIQPAIGQPGLQPVSGLQPIQPIGQPAAGSLRPINVAGGVPLQPSPLQPIDSSMAKPPATGGLTPITGGEMPPPLKPAVPVAGGPMPSAKPVAPSPMGFKGPAQIGGFGKPLSNNQAFTTGFNSARGQR